MRPLWGLMINTLRETLRQGFFIILAVVGIAILVVLIFVPLTTLGSNVDMYKDAGISLTLLFALLVGLLGAATGIAKEVDDRTALTVLSKPLGRWQFVLGKYFGVLMASGLIIIILGFVLALAVFYRVDIEAVAIERAQGMGQFAQGEEGFMKLRISQAITVMPGLVLAFFEVGVLVAITTALSTRLSSILSVGLGLGCFIVGHLTMFLEVAARGGSAAARGVTAAAITVLPFLDTFNINAKLSHTILPLFGDMNSGDTEIWSEVWSYVGFAGIYTVLYVAVVLTIAGLLFRRRQLE